MKLVLEYILFGFLTGFLSGITPGPLLFLAISETLKGNIKNGILVSLSPIFSDIPVLLLSLLLRKQFEHIKGMLELISIIGGIFLIYLGIKELFSKKTKVSLKTDASFSFLKGILINLLSPYTYLFWFFIGAPILEKSSIYEMLIFLFSYFSGIFFSMLIIVFLAEKIKTFLESKMYIILIRITGLLFIVFGFFLIFNTLEEFSS